jgi:hypothetical protein
MMLFVVMFFKLMTQFLKLPHGGSDLTVILDRLHVTGEGFGLSCAGEERRFFPLLNFDDQLVITSGWMTLIPPTVFANVKPVIKQNTT